MREPNTFKAGYMSFMRDTFAARASGEFAAILTLAVGIPALLAVLIALAVWAL